MPKYLIQGSYTPESWATMSKNPQDREALIRPVVEAMGGKLDAFYMAFGKFDYVAIADLPSNEDAAAFAISVTSTGAMSRYETTPLFESAAAVEAMRRSSGTNYAPPG